MALQPWEKVEKKEQIIVILTFSLFDTDPYLNTKSNFLKRICHLLPVAGLVVSFRNTLS